MQFQDFKAYAENGTLEDNPVLERSVSLFNGLSQWIQSVVLNRATPSQRADVIAKFVHVAKVRLFKFFKARNFLFVLRRICTILKEINFLQWEYSCLRVICLLLLFS